jgi:hypothetical protein
MAARATTILATLLGFFFELSTQSTKSQQYALKSARELKLTLLTWGTT